MYLAWREMRRAVIRFGLLVAAVGLLVFLILVQQTLQEGLLGALVGGLRNQSAPVVVLSVDARRNLQGGIVTPALAGAVQAVDGVGRTGRLGQRAFSAAGGDQVALLGYDDPALGGPTTLTTGRLPGGPDEVVASDVDADLGYGIGERVRIEPGGYEMTVVGLASDARLFASPTLYGTWATYERAVAAANPDARAPLPSALAAEPVPGVTPAELAGRIDGAVPDAESLTRAQLADATPGVAQIRQSFQVLFLLYGLVVPFVTGLFFLIVTFQKAGALTLLRAVGVPARRLVSSLLLQVALVVAAGIAVGTALYAPLSVQRLGSIALRFQPGAVLGWGIVLLVLALVSAAFSASRVLRIEPMAATTGAGVGR